MRKSLHVFICTFSFTVIMILVFAAMLFCERQSLMVRASSETRLLAMKVNEPAQLSITLLGEELTLDCSYPMLAEQYRRQYYALLPCGVKLLEQAIWYTTQGLNELAGSNSR
ncbi:hypothetical protein [Acetanaerobacterium elongatum]|uniref:Uncharacterized protein n=1 Tax=Acetanaerobacterium elongatum TaxID=258515 RepID=A0A1H0GUC6_9FIRM|nr:hypothetical protein [Acetanaerobacterium elongatum]SDO10261.1 hypothetical protein SAMN05192585_15512 [Acetanaerobacterium elongatum]